MIEMKALIHNGLREAELYLSGDIFKNGDEAVSEMNIRRELKKFGAHSSITAYINSPGGDMFEGVAIYNMLSELRVPVTTVVQAMCASAATLVAMSGKTRLIQDNARYMIHDPMTMAFGNQEEMLKAAKVLGDFRNIALDTYAAGVNKKSSREQIDKWMRDETWMTPKESVDRGFSTGIYKRKGAIQQQALAEENLALLSKFKNLPADIKQQVERVDWKIAHMKRVVFQQKYPSKDGAAQKTALHHPRNK